MRWSKCSVCWHSTTRHRPIGPFKSATVWRKYIDLSGLSNRGDLAYPLAPMRTVFHIALIVALVGCVVALAAHGPSTTYASAQLQQIGAVIGTIQSGNWLLPRDQFGGLARKPQLYAWLGAPMLMAKGIYDDITFRLPTIIASLITAVLVYLLARRWHGAATGLLAACLWVSIQHMSKMMYVAITDMLLAMWIIASIMCADRLLLHRAPLANRKWWAIGLWATMIFAAMTKGWGVLNLCLIGGMFALATAVGPGFGLLRRVEGIGVKASVAARLVLRRWRRAAKATYFVWGILAMVLVLAPVWAGMFAQGGHEFRQIAKYEFWSRITGGGAASPHAASSPPAIALLHYMFPATIFAIGALLLVRPRKWFARLSPVSLPLCWILSLVVPFSLTHGFRPDYLLPCYAAGAIMGAWAIMELIRRSRAGRMESFVRHLFAGGAIFASLAIAVLSAFYLFYEHLPEFVTNAAEPPAYMEYGTAGVFAALIPLGLIGVGLAIWASLTWRIRVLTAVTIIAMLGVMFVDRHAISRHARTFDGEKLQEFGNNSRKLIGPDAKFAVYRAGKLGTEVYLGRFGARIDPPKPSGRVEYMSFDERSDLVRQRAGQAIENLTASGAKWLITCDKGLVELGAADEADGGEYVLKLNAKEHGRKSIAFWPRPDLLGEIFPVARTAAITSQRWGRAYAIRLDAEKLDKFHRDKLYLNAWPVGYRSGKQQKDRTVSE